MKNFPVDNDVVALVWKLANPRPFENLTFCDALRRVLPALRLDTGTKKAQRLSIDEMLAELDAMGDEDLRKLHRYDVTRRQRAPSPSPDKWTDSVPELRSVPNLGSWQDICRHLGIEVGGDSARRKLEDWVQNNHPEWPRVPQVDSHQL